MKKFTAALLCALLLFTLCSCAGNDDNAPDGTTKVVNEPIGCTVYYPEGWKVDRNDGMLTLLYDTSASSMVSTYASISVNLYSTHCKDYTAYWEASADRFATELKDFKLIENTETKLGKVTAGCYHYTATVDGSTYHFVQAIAVGSYEAYIVTFTASEDDYEDRRGDFDTIIGYFEFN